MAPRYLLSLTVLLALTACDSDDDGLSNSKEEAIGTNPDVADTDGDGLLDGARVGLAPTPSPKTRIPTDWATATR